MGYICNMKEHIFLEEEQGHDSPLYSHIANEIRKGYLEGWLSKEDVLYALQNRRIDEKEYQWIIS